MSRPTLRRRKEAGFYREDHRVWVRKDDQLTLEEVSSVSTGRNIDESSKRCKQRDRETLMSVMVGVLCSDSMETTWETTYSYREMLSKASFPALFSTFPEVSQLDELVVFQLKSISVHMKEFSDDVWRHRMSFLVVSSRASNRTSRFQPISHDYFFIRWAWF
jgi:hypothetical protein